MISRDWRCLNDRCGETFHSFANDNPPCPACGCVRVGWIPGGGHVNSIAPRMDARIRSIADQHGLTNLNSPSNSRLNRAMPRAPIHPTVPGVTHNWGFGISSPIPDAHHPNAGAIASFSATSVSNKVVVGDSAQSRDSRWLPGPLANSVIVARTKQRGI